MGLAIGEERAMKTKKSQTEKKKARMGFGIQSVAFNPSPIPSPGAILVSRLSKANTKSMRVTCSYD